MKSNCGKICFCHQSYGVYDDINLLPCFKCSPYGHNPKKCINKPTCIICLENHLTTDCKNKTKPQVFKLCIFKQFRLKRDTSHTANDTEKYEISKHQINKVMNTIKYPVKPTIPKYLGHISNTDQFSKYKYTHRKGIKDN